MGSSERRFPFAFSPRFRPVLALLGVGEDSAYVTVGDSEVGVRFGPWLLRSERSNVTAVEISGPYAWWKAIGPRLSVADRGVTFGTNADRGVCLRFAAPVPGLAPFGLVKHPGVTVTVADPEGLRAALG